MRSGRAKIKILINQTAYFIHPQPHYTPNKIKNKAKKRLDIQQIQFWIGRAYVF